MNAIRAFIASVFKATIEAAVKAIASAILLAAKTAVVTCAVAGVGVLGYSAYVVQVEGGSPTEVPAQVVRLVSEIADGMDVLRAAAVKYLNEE